jgi:cell division protein FtsL
MRRRKSASLKPKSIMGAIAVCSVISLAGIGYIWAKTEVYSLGRQIKTLEVRLDELHSTNDAMKREFAVMCTQTELGRRVKSLGLVAPAPDQIIRIPEPTSVIPKPEARAFAAQLE